MHKPEVELAERSQIATLEETAIVFLQDILGMDYSEIVMTDESALSDFAGCGDSRGDFRT